MKIQLKLPAKIEVQDYHEFRDLEDKLQQLNRNIRVKDAGFNGDYIGLVYVGKLSDKDNKSLLDMIKKETKEFDDSEY